MAPLLNKVYVIFKFKNDKSWFVTIIFIVFRLNFRAKNVMNDNLAKVRLFSQFQMLRFYPLILVFETPRWRFCNWKTRHFETIVLAASWISLMQLGREGAGRFELKSLLLLQLHNSKPLCLRRSDFLIILNRKLWEKKEAMCQWPSILRYSSFSHL